MCFTKHVVLSLWVPLSLYYAGVSLFIIKVIRTRFIRTYVYNLAIVHHLLDNITHLYGCLTVVSPFHSQGELALSSIGRLQSC